MLTEEDLLFGKIAVDMNLLAASQLDRVKEEIQKNPQLKIGALLIQKGYIYPWDLEEILAEQAKRKKQHQAEHVPAVGLTPLVVETVSAQPTPSTTPSEPPSGPSLPEPLALNAVPVTSDLPPAPSLKITPPPAPLRVKLAPSQLPTGTTKGLMSGVTTKITVSPGISTAPSSVQKSIDAVPSARPAATSESLKIDATPSTAETNKVSPTPIPTHIPSHIPSPSPQPVPVIDPPLEAQSSPLKIASPNLATEDVFTPTASSAPIPVVGMLREYLEQARTLGASDLHLSVGTPPFIRKFKNIEILPYPVLTPEDTETLIFQSISEAQKKYLFKNKSLDFCLTIPGVGRYRTCFYKQINGWEAAFRVIPNEVRSFEELKLPPALKRLTEYPQGLILVTGPAGSGKTSTLAAMIDLINQTREDHIITIEDPVEYLQLPKHCQVSQRELGTHTKTFASALKAALRQDPDIIMIGEMRDRETMALAISASETGHLVLATMPTSSAVRTINAVIDFFPPDQQGQIRSMISESLRGIICQNLIPNAQGKGVELALEILLFDPAVATVIRNNQLHQLITVIQTGKAKGMKSLDDSLTTLVQQGAIDPEEAFALAENKLLFEQYRKKK